jgi:ribosomal protein L37AE/L43A
VSARLGPVQRAVLLIMADGTARTTDRVESDAMLSTGRGYSALMGLARRGYVERDHTSGHDGMLWSLSDKGQTLAEDVHGLREGEEDDPTPRCPHGRAEDEPCKDCRLGPWRCNDCGTVVTGGTRAPHRREAHGEWRYRRAGQFTWAG